METEDTKESIEELSTIFSTANFACDAGNKESLAMDDDGSDLDIGKMSYNIKLYSDKYHFGYLLV